MTMEKDASYFTVGIFVTLAFLALVGFSIWLAGGHDFAKYQRYTIYFTDPVSGLTNEATVKYKGVQVGRILDIRLAPERTDLVKVDVEVKEETPIRAGTVAGIEIHGITGQSYIELDTATTDMDLPMRIAGEPYPVLKGTGSELRKFFEELPKVGSQLASTLSAIREFSKEGSKTADSVRALSDKLEKDPSQILRPPPSNRGVVIPK
jgi:phospholipid/cholesterol/gamma-HCH transport system substrate-binding protein